MAYYIVRDCKKTGREDRLRPDFQDIDDARANCEILKAGDLECFYWVRSEIKSLSEIQALVKKSLGMKPESIIICRA